MGELGIVDDGREGEMKKDGEPDWAGLRSGTRIVSGFASVNGGDYT